MWSQVREIIIDKFENIFKKFDLVKVRNFFFRT